MRGCRAPYVVKQAVREKFHSSFHSRCRQSQQHPMHHSRHLQHIKAVCIIRVYDGEGAGSRSVLSTVESLTNTLSPDFQVQVSYHDLSLHGFVCVHKAL